LLVFKLSELRLKRHVFTIFEEKMSQDKKVAVETKLTEEEKLFEEKKTVDPYMAGFIESMAKTNTEKITKEILEGLSEDTDDSDSYDVESGDEDSEDRP
jgi:flavodoxin